MAVAVQTAARAELDLEFRYGAHALTLRIEGLTLADTDDRMMRTEQGRAEAGALALSLFCTELKNGPTRCPVDRVNDLLEERLRSATPDYGRLSEKASTKRGSASGWLWIVASD